ncbi:hypothetical protein [Polycladidibacter stylochi]|uniref:hypothetical protein n=1 Tax=Polycladidibacter stylochi TaxID=1807766 RepID=UPI00082BB78F|nr:hypothetical protein [Pseudovibrio stylochi]
MTGSRDFSKHLYQVADIGIKVIIAGIAAYTSYSFQQKQHENKLTELLSSMVYSQDHERAKTGIDLAIHHYEDGAIPKSLLLSYANYINSHRELKDTALYTNYKMETVTQDDRKFAKSLAALEQLYPMAFIVYSSDEFEANDEKTRELSNALFNFGMVMNRNSLQYPTQTINQMTADNEIRCFSQKACTVVGKELVNYLRRTGYNFSLKDHSKKAKSAHNQKRLHPHMVEVWMGAKDQM